MPVFTGARRPANGTASALGIEVLPLDPQLRKELHVPKEVNGVVVGKVASDSPAGELGIQPGRRDLVSRSEAGDNTRGAVAQLKQAAEHGNVLLLLNRHGTGQFVGLSVENNGTAGSSR